MLQVVDQLIGQRVACAGVERSNLRLVVHLNLCALYVSRYKNNHALVALNRFRQLAGSGSKCGTDSSRLYAFCAEAVCIFFQFVDMTYLSAELLSHLFEGLGISNELSNILGFLAVQCLVAQRVLYFLKVAVLTVVASGQSGYDIFVAALKYVTYIAPNEMKRLVVTIYLEGWDKECSNDLINSAFSAHIAFMGEHRTVAPNYPNY